MCFMYAQRQEILIDEALDEGSADNPARNRTAGPESALGCHVGDCTFSLLTVIVT